MKTKKYESMFAFFVVLACVFLFFFFLTNNGGKDQVSMRMFGWSVFFFNFVTGIIVWYWSKWKHNGVAVESLYHKGKFRVVEQKKTDSGFILVLMDLDDKITRTFLLGKKHRPLYGAKNEPVNEFPDTFQVIMGEVPVIDSAKNGEWHIRKVCHIMPISA